MYFKDNRKTFEITTNGCKLHYGNFHITLVGEWYQYPLETDPISSYFLLSFGFPGGFFNATLTKTDGQQLALNISTKDFLHETNCSYNEVLSFKMTTTLVCRTSVLLREQSYIRLYLDGALYGNVTSSISSMKTISISNCFLHFHFYKRFFTISFLFNSL